MTFDPQSNVVNLPEISAAPTAELAELRDSVRNEGLLAYYVALSVTNLGME